MDDYYAILGVRRSAPPAVIDRAVRQQLRQWQRRTASADLARRQEAEWRVRQLSEARVVLLDELRRQQYDRQLDAQRSSAPSPPPELPAPRSEPPVPRSEPAVPRSEPPVPSSRGPARPPLPAEALEFRLRMVHRAGPMLGVGGALLLAVLGTVAGVAWLAVISLFCAVFSTGVFFAYRDHGVVLDAEGITIRSDVIQRYPWAQVRSIEATEVKGTLRVEICTVDGMRIRPPAPRGRRLAIDRDFAADLATMRRWHDRYGPRSER